MSDSPWQTRMPDDQFTRMRDILAAPSPIGLEAAMTEGVLRPMAAKFAPDDWAVHTFRGNAGVVFDTKPGDEDAFSVMVIGHADQIRMQVRSIGEDGKIWIETDSFLPTTLIGHEVRLFSEGEDGKYRVIEGGTVEALGAIHFASPELRTGRKGITKEMVYLELGLHGEKRKKQVEKLGIRAGDSILLNRRSAAGSLQTPTTARISTTVSAAFS